MRKHEPYYHFFYIWQDRIGRFKEAVEFLELCGFEETEDEDDEFLILSHDKIDMGVLNLAGSLLKTALTNPFFGRF